jgi:lysophospholipase L1-like esterase
LKRSWFLGGRAALVVIGVAGGILAAEVALRLKDPSLDFHFPTARVTDEQFVRRAGQTTQGQGVSYTFDADGFRSSGVPAPPANAPTVLFIGDSFTQGFGVSDDQTFPAATCRQLAARGIGARCLNAGVTGFGTAHELRLLNRLLADNRIRIDAVVFQVLPSNDLSDDWEDGGFGLVGGGRLVTHDPPQIPFVVRLRQAFFDGKLARSSWIVKLIANAWLAGQGLDPHYDDASFELERRLLEEVVATVQRRGIPIVIAVCATSWELHGTIEQPYDAQARIAFVNAAVDGLGVPWIDSRAIAPAPEDYIPNDGHLSVAGNALLGEAVASRLARVLRQ